MLANACQAGDLPMVQTIIAQDPSLITSWYGKANHDYEAQAIHIAAFHGHLDIIRYLLDHGASLSDRCRYGMTVMMYAAMSRRVDVVAALFDMAPDLLFDLSDNCSSLMTCAAISGSCDMIDWLAAHGLSIHHPDAYDITPITHAAQGGWLHVVRHLIELGADPRQVDADNELILHAALYNRLDIVMYLLRIVWHESFVNDSVVSQIIQENLQIIVQWMDTSRAASNALFSSTDLHVIQRCKAIITFCRPDIYRVIQNVRWNIFVFRWLVEECGLAVDGKYQQNDTLLLLACYCGEIQVVKYLLETGRSCVTECNIWRNTCIYFAAWQGHGELCLWLVEFSMRVGHPYLIDAKCEGGLPPLAAAKNLETVKLLAMCGADRSVRVMDADTAVWLRSVANLNSFEIAVVTRNMAMASWILYNRDVDCRRAAALAMDTTFAPVCSGMNALVRRVLQPWNFANHFMYGPRHRRDVFLLYTVRLRLEQKNIFLPDIIYVRIAQMFGRIY